MAPIPCYRPTNVRFTWNLGVLKIDWDGTAASYRLKRRTGDGPEVDMGEVFDETIQVAGLLVGTQYGFFITSVCGSKESIPAYQSYIIPSNEPGPTNVRFLAQTETEVQIAWNGPSGLYIVSWAKGDDPEPEFKAVEDNTSQTTLQGLDPAQNYTFEVRRHIGSFVVEGDKLLYKKASEACCGGADGDGEGVPGPQGPQGPPGEPGDTAGIVVGEIPSGAINGSNATFTTAFPFVQETLEVFCSHVALDFIDDYQVTGSNTIQLVESPLVGERIKVNYIKTSN